MIPSKSLFLFFLSSFVAGLPFISLYFALFSFPIFFSNKIYKPKHFRFRESESNRTTAELLRRELDVQAAQHEEQTSGVEGDLKVEREWRISLQETMQQDRERISKLQTEISQLKIIAQVN